MKLRTGCFVGPANPKLEEVIEKAGHWIDQTINGLRKRHHK